MKYYYCYNTQKGLFEIEMTYAKDLGLYIFYDEEKDAFFDKDGNQIDIKDKPIFPRSGILQSKSLVDAIIRHGGNSLVKRKDYDKTLNWPYYIKTKRNNIILSGSQIISNPELIVNTFGNDTVFFKTKHKNFSRIIDISQLFNHHSAIYQTLKLHQDEDFILSDAVSIDKDEHGPLEYRAFIINGTIYNISRVSDSLLGRIPQIVLDILEDLVDSLKNTDFPLSYVIDLFIYKDKDDKRVVDVLECNPIIASGTYLYNSIFSQIADLIHTCPSSSIPKEKIKYGKANNYSFNITDNIIPSIFYNLPKGFASDLTAISLFGYKPEGDIHFHMTNSNEQTIPSLSTIEVVNSDIELEKSSPKSKKKSKTPQ